MYARLFVSTMSNDIYIILTIISTYYIPNQIWPELEPLKVILETLTSWCPPHLGHRIYIYILIVPIYSGTQFNLAQVWWRATAGVAAGGGNRVLPEQFVISFGRTSRSCDDRLPTVICLPATYNNNNNNIMAASPAVAL